nr:immunoglobulin heavy chain junction region [Mus musculus]
CARRDGYSPFDYW